MVAKIWTLEAFRSKIVISGGARVFLKFWGWLEGLVAKDWALAKCGNFPKRAGTAAIFSRSSGA
jgi:hypothetical protein